MLAVLILLIGVACNTAVADDPLGGASIPNALHSTPPQDPTDESRNDYSQIHQFAIKHLISGYGEKSLEYLDQIAAQFPRDGETYFAMAIVHAQLGELDPALDAMARAIALGLPPERFVAGPRSLLMPLHDHQRFRELTADVVLVHGPMVGSVTDTAASFWVRTAREAEVMVSIGQGTDVELFDRSAVGRSRALDDYTAVVTIEGLNPDTQYHYRVRVTELHSNRVAQTELQSFHTFPANGRPARFSVAFGGGAGYIPPHERMWDTIRAFSPLAMLMLGDNVYIDDPETPEIQRYTYYRRQSSEPWRRLVASTAIFSIYDDHDFGTNDSYGGRFVETPAWKKQIVWPIFKQNWVNPGYGQGDEHPGCYYDFVIGDVHFIMLDNRYYRQDPGRYLRPGDEKPENPDMLGPVQMAWLKETLSRSRTTFKVIASSVPFDFRAKTGQAGLDTWRGHPHEREEIFSFIESNRIEGVVLISADRHRSDAWLIERPDGYNFYEFSSSRLTNYHTHQRMPEAIFSYNELPSFGLLEFDTTANGPTVTYYVVNIDGQTVHTLPLERSMMSFTGATE